MNHSPDLICFSHLRWGFVYQRPNHLMSRFGKTGRVFFFEEPVFYDSTENDQGCGSLVVNEVTPGVWRIVPQLPRAVANDTDEHLRSLLDELISQYQLRDFVAWFYTPLALKFARHLQPKVTVYDCMDELTAFHGAPPALAACEAELLARADLVFTGGQSLYEAKRDRHPHVVAFPSSVDAAHFAKAQIRSVEPPDQVAIATPRLGFFGVIDERIDLGLLAHVAAERPHWQLVLLGPVVKIDPALLPQGPNLHWLGSKAYEDLPAYLAGWNVALMPFALNEATRFISPTKTLEYLAAGINVVATAVRDVVRPYGEAGAVRIADQRTFVAEIEAALADPVPAMQAAAERLVASTSWDHTFVRMAGLITTAMKTSRRFPSGPESKNPCLTIS